jgi:hypothetical protein
MPWTTDRWPPQPGDAIDTDLVLNQARAALEERDGLVQAGWAPEEFARWDPLLGTPRGGDPAPFPTVANFQYEVQEMLLLDWPYRWWDDTRGALYTLAALCQDAFGRDGWTYDLTATHEGGSPVNRWTPPYALLFEELYQAVNQLEQVRILPTVSQSLRHDSVYRLTSGIQDWAAERAATFALFDGQDDGQTVGLAYDVGMGGEVIDNDTSQHWMLESRRFRMTFATGGLDGYTVRRAWLEFTTAAPSGSADFSDTFTAEVAVEGGAALGTFASDDYGAKRFEVSASAVNTDDDTVFEIRSTRPDSADRSAWTPDGPDYTSTYREGLAMTGPVRLIVEVDFEYHG